MGKKFTCSSNAESLVAYLYQLKDDYFGGRIPNMTLSGWNRMTKHLNRHERWSEFEAGRDVWFERFCNSLTYISSEGVKQRENNEILRNYVCEKLGYKSFRDFEKIANISIPFLEKKMSGIMLWQGDEFKRLVVAAGMPLCDFDLSEKPWEQVPIEFDVSFETTLEMMKNFSDGELVEILRFISDRLSLETYYGDCETSNSVTISSDGTVSDTVSDDDCVWLSKDAFDALSKGAVVNLLHKRASELFDEHDLTYASEDDVSKLALLIHEIHKIVRNRL